jgi:hypothetical protein
VRVDDDALASAREAGPVQAGPAGAGLGRLRSVIRRGAIWEHLPAPLPGLLVVVVHDVGYLLSQPF